MPEAQGTRGRRPYLEGGGLCRRGGYVPGRQGSGRGAGGRSACSGVLTRRSSPPTPEPAAGRQVNPCVAGYSPPLRRRGPAEADPPSPPGPRRLSQGLPSPTHRRPSVLPHPHSELG